MARSIWQKTITNETGDIQDGVQITVNVQGGGLATIYDNQSGGTVKANPFLTGADGVVKFFAEPGFYEVTAFKNGETATFEWNNIGDSRVREDLAAPAIDVPIVDDNGDSVVELRKQLAEAGSTVQISGELASEVASLRAQLSEQGAGKGSDLVNGADFNVESLINLLDVPFVDGKFYGNGGFYPDTVVGGGRWKAVASEPHANFTGGTVVTLEALQAWKDAAIAAGGLTKQNLIDTVNVFLDWTGAGTGAFVRLSENINVTYFGAAPDDQSIDDYQSFLAAKNTNKPVYIPVDKGYYLSQPLDVTGDDSVSFYSDPVDMRRSSGLDHTKIYAPNGLLKNTGTDRVFLSFKFLVLEGAESVAGVYSSKLFDGRFGGAFEGCALARYEYLMFNDYAYLLFFYRCRFNECKTAFSVATANGSIIDSCWFGSSVGTYIDMLDENLPIGGQSAIRNSVPFKVTNTNFNLGAKTKRLSRTRGGFIFSDSNYIESFSAPTNPDEFLMQHIAGRFDGGFISVEKNEINGSSEWQKLLHVYSNSTSGTSSGRFSGTVENNRIIGFMQSKLIKIGGVVDGSGTTVSGIEIKKNNGAGTPLADYIDYSGDAANIYNSFVVASYSGELDISGASYIKIPITEEPPSIPDQIDVDGNWNKRNPGLYKISAVITLSSDTDIRNIEAVMDTDGVSTSFVDSITHGAGGSWYTTGTLEQIIRLGGTGAVSISARNGASVTRVKFTAHRIGD